MGLIDVKDFLALSENYDKLHEQSTELLCNFLILVAEFAPTSELGTSIVNLIAQLKDPWRDRFTIGVAELRMVLKKKHPYITDSMIDNALIKLMEKLGVPPF